MFQRELSDFDLKLKSYGSWLLKSYAGLTGSWKPPLPPAICGQKHPGALGAHADFYFDNPKK